MDTADTTKLGLEETPAAAENIPTIQALLENFLATLPENEKDKIEPTTLSTIQKAVDNKTIKQISPSIQQIMDNVTDPIARLLLLALEMRIYVEYAEYEECGDENFACEVEKKYHRLIEACEEQNIETLAGQPHCNNLLNLYTLMQQWSRFLEFIDGRFSTK